MIDVSIILVNYNTISFLINAVDSIFTRTEGIEYEIIVVDNNSTDNSKNILAEKYCNSIIFLGLHDNLGFGRANNEAVKIAKGKNLFFLNPDTVLLNNAVRILSNYMDANPKVGCCGGNLVDTSGRPVHSFSRYVTPSVFEEVSLLLHMLPVKILYGKNEYYNHTNKPLKVAYITGADLMVRKELFNRLQGFDSDFFMYSEEAELEYRIKKMKYEIINVPSVQIIHLEGVSLSDNTVRIREIMKSRQLFLRKTQNKIMIFLINKLFYFRISFYLFEFTILKREDRKSYWLAHKDGFMNALNLLNKT